MNKLRSVPAELNQLRNVVDNDMVKKPCIINWLQNSELLILGTEYYQISLQNTI